MQSRAPGPRATGLSWLGPGQPGLGQHGASTLHSCVTSGQSGGLSRSGDSGTSQGLWRAAGAAESQPPRGSGWGEQGLHRAVPEPGQWTPGRPACGGRDYSGTAAQRRLGQECLYLCQMDFILWFACIFSINLTKVYISSLVAQRLKRLPPMRETGFNPWVGTIHWRRKWQPAPVFLPGESHGRRSLVGYSLLGYTEWDMTEQFHFSRYTCFLYSHDYHTHICVFIQET